MISRSNITRATALFGPRLWKCGSIDDGSEASAIVRSCACAAIGNANVAANANAVSFFRWNMPTYSLLYELFC